MVLEFTSMMIIYDMCKNYSFLFSEMTNLLARSITLYEPRMLAGNVSKFR